MIEGLGLLIHLTWRSIRSLAVRWCSIGMIGRRFTGGIGDTPAYARSPFRKATLDINEVFQVEDLFFYLLANYRLITDLTARRHEPVRAKTPAPD